jgi:TonB family protein
MCFSRHSLRHGAASAMLVVLFCLALPAGAQSPAKVAAHATSTSARKAAPVDVCDPDWPESAPVISNRRATKLMLQVNAKGAVISTKLIQSSNSEPLDKATIEAAMNCQFIPALKQGKLVPSKVPFSYAWDQIVVVQQPPPMPAPVSAKADFASCAKPKWPKASLRNEETGTVTMEFLIGTDGVVKEKKIKKSSGFVDLDSHSLEAIAKCKFQPATRSGQPIDSWAKIQYVWTLE